MILKRPAKGKSYQSRSGGAIVTIDGLNYTKTHVIYTYLSTGTTVFKELVEFNKTFKETKA